MVGDSELAQKVASALATSERINLPSSAISVTAEAGVVILDGFASSLEEKKLAALIAGETDGVRAIVDQIKVDDGLAAADDLLQQRVQAALDSDPYLMESRLQAVVCNGDVHLEGRVNSLVDKKIAEATVWWLRGVQSVTNDIAVVPDEAESDGVLADTVRAILEKDTLIDQANVWLGVHDRVVSLSGAVPSDEQRRAAEFDAWSVPGVRDVVNLIRVEAV
ncbi:MAG: BON domain-containing protein [Chloroflexi bacterium]|nr:BON domain-containing protein [Chloroflexota bacterium]